MENTWFRIQSDPEVSLLLNICHQMASDTLGYIEDLLLAPELISCTPRISMWLPGMSSLKNSANSWFA